jgi:hypothetical protein
LEQAKDDYLFYREEFEEILSNFEVQQETHLFTCQEPKNFKKLSLDEQQYQLLTMRAIKNLWTMMRNRFKKNCDTKDEQLKKASAWYVACYGSRLNTEKRILSFPWMLEDLLIEIKLQSPTKTIRKQFMREDQLRIMNSYFGNKNNVPKSSSLSKNHTNYEYETILKNFFEKAFGENRAENEEQRTFFMRCFSLLSKLNYFIDQPPELWKFLVNEFFSSWKNDETFVFNSDELENYENEISIRIESIRK